MSSCTQKDCLILTITGIDFVVFSNLPDRDIFSCRLHLGSISSSKPTTWWSWKTHELTFPIKRWHGKNPWVCSFFKVASFWWTHGSLRYPNGRLLKYEGFRPKTQQRLLGVKHVGVLAQTTVSDLAFRVAKHEYAYNSRMGPECSSQYAPGHVSGRWVVIWQAMTGLAKGCEGTKRDKVASIRAVEGARVFMFAPFRTSIFFSSSSFSCIYIYTFEMVFWGYASQLHFSVSWWTINGITMSKPHMNQPYSSAFVGLSPRHRKPPWGSKHSGVTERRWVNRINPTEHMKRPCPILGATTCTAVYRKKFLAFFVRLHPPEG